jgi:hypothetical protein
VNDVSHRSARWWAGWAAVAASTSLSCFWAFWGSAENFHEGWYYREWYRNAGLALAQYLPWMFVPMGAALAALWKPWVGFLLHLGLAAAAISLFGLDSVGGRLIALPIAFLGALYVHGRPAPARWARRALVLTPLLTAVAAGAYPAWRVFTRPSDVVTGAVHIVRPGIDITWAPAGPGWGHGVTWGEATRRCAFLDAGGTTPTAAPVDVWRLPTVDEAARSMIYRGRDAEGRWNAEARVTSFTVQPDKEAPLWNPFSHVIYLWTSTERDAQRAYFISYNGQAHPRNKSAHPGYQGYRCVRLGPSGSHAVAVAGFVGMVGWRRRRIERIDDIDHRDLHAANRRDDRMHVAVGERLAVVRDRHQRAVDLDQFVPLDFEAEIGAALLHGMPP